MEVKLWKRFTFIKPDYEFDWGYSRDNGPDQWLIHFEDCLGNVQSPIAIETSQCVYDPSLGAFDFDGYDESQGVLVAVNIGKTVQVNLMEGDWILTGGSIIEPYLLRQFHFHWGADSCTGSEHTVDSRRYPLEMHMVHVSSKYDSCYEALNEERGIVVLSILFETGDSDNEAFQGIVDNLGNVVFKGQKVALATFPIRQLMPSNLTDYYTYSGSLTTPPCSEIVIWNVFRDVVTISERQLEAFRKLRLHEMDEDSSAGVMVNNYRPLQDLNGRMTRKSFQLTNNYTDQSEPLLTHEVMPVKRTDSPVSTSNVPL